jgi:hypothetical protein
MSQIDISLAAGTGPRQAAYKDCGRRGLHLRDLSGMPTTTAGGNMKRLLVLILTLGLLAVPAVAGARPAVQRHVCAVQHRFLGSRSDYRWWRGTSRNPADESFRTTTYRYGSGSCARIPFRRWRSISNYVFSHGSSGQAGGSLSGPGIRGTWRHIKTFEIPNTCEDGGPSGSTPYGLFGLRVSNLSGRLLGTGTVKLRLAC